MPPAAPLAAGDLEVRPWNRHADYPVLVGWWRSLPDWDPPPAPTLPDSGRIVMQDERPLCAGFWYLVDNAPLAYLGWPVFAPDCPLKTRPAAAALLWRDLVACARQDGARQIVRNEGVSALRRMAQTGAGMRPGPAPLYTAYWTDSGERLVALEGDDVPLPG